MCGVFVCSKEKKGDQLWQNHAKDDQDERICAQQYCRLDQCVREGLAACHRGVFGKSASRRSADRTRNEKDCRDCARETKQDERNESGRECDIARTYGEHSETVAEIVKNETTQLPEKIAFVGTGEVTITIRFFVTGNDRIGEAVKTVTKTVTAVGVNFADSSKVTLAIGEKSTREASVTPDTYKAVYSVKDGSTDVITVNAATGEVTAIAVGTKTIVATVQGGATAEYEVEVIAALSSITVTNATTFDNDINYGAENIELDIILDNDYTFNSAGISVIASDADYVSVINTDGKYYAVINKITYGTKKRTA